MSSREISIWIDERWYDALTRNLKGDRQISVAAKRKLRDAQRKILTSEANQKHVPTEFTRSDLILIEKALRSLQEQRSRTVTHALGNLADIMDNDPLYYYYNFSLP